MLLITSAAYIDQELKSIFGKIIPAFLPVKNKRLFFHQIIQFPTIKDRFLSIPEDFEISEYDNEFIKNFNLSIIRVPNNMTLGESVLFCINWIGKYSENLTILHGDTLIINPPKTNADYCSISKISDNYDWATSDIFESNNTYTGLFQINSISLFAKLLLENRYDFIKSIESYRKIILTTKLILTDNWFDFGHTSTYFQSRSQLTSERSFNKIKCEASTITKSSHQILKIRSEAQWFHNIPDNIKIFTPYCFSYIEKENDASYQLEYIFQPVLNELYVFGRIPTYIWEQIIDKCFSFLDTLHVYKSPKDITLQSEGLIKLKTNDRLKDFCTNTNIDLDKKWSFNGKKTLSLREIATITSNMINFKDNSFQTVIHGDFCFSNILYDFRAKNIKVIDPRGIDVYGTETIYGDIRYDIAKLAHSVIGLYDFIIADYYNLTIHDYTIEFHIKVSENIQSIQKYFLIKSFQNRNHYQMQIFPITIHLFLSMLPLHSENANRQLALMANIFRLYYNYIAENEEN